MPEGTLWPVAVGSPIVVVMVVGMKAVVELLVLALAPVIGASGSVEVVLAPST